MLFKFKALWRSSANDAMTNDISEQMLLGLINNNTAVAFFDALGLPAFTVIGVIVAMEADATPFGCGDRCSPR